MKKTLLLSLLAVFSVLSSWADDYTYPYLVFTDNSGNQTTWSVDGLEMTFENGALQAKTATGNQTLTLADLVSMQFSETGTVTTAISKTGSKPLPVDIYTLTGIRLGTYADLNAAQTALPHGAYLVKQDGKTQKICVK